MLATVAVVAVPGMAPFEFGILCEVFGIDRTAQGAPPFDFRAVAADPGPIPLPHGMTLEVPHGLDAAADADLVAIPAVGRGTADPRVLDLVRDAHARGAWVLSVCSGAFTLAQAGILDGRPATTHWMYTDELARRHPAIDIDPDVLFVESDRIVTSAGTASGIDASLHIVRRELGANVANIIARRMVVPPQRDGGQAQYIAVPIPDRRTDSMADLIDWVQEHLAEDLPIERLARQALMSERSFARRFRAETGTTPAAWIARQRITRAQHLLEATDDTVDEIARAVGFGSGALLRHHFQQSLGTAPLAYRRTFSAR